MNLAKRIRDYRYAKGWGPDELASRAEISRTALYQIESGKTELPRAGTLRRIAQALEVSIDVLLGNADPGAFDMPSFTRGATESETAVAGRRPMKEEPAESHRAAGQRPSETLGGVPPESYLGAAHSSMTSWSLSPRESELTRKFQELLGTPLGEGLARVVEETYRLMPYSQSKRLV